MTDKQPDALILADALDQTLPINKGGYLCGEAAIELRRLHNDNELLKALLDKAQDRADEFAAEKGTYFRLYEMACNKMQKQDKSNQELVSALQDVCTQLLHRGVFTDPEHPDRVALDAARAAIAKHRGEA